MDKQIYNTAATNKQIKSLGLSLGEPKGEKETAIYLATKPKRNNTKLRDVEIKQQKKVYD